jgi:hypothetical protein
MDEERKEFEVDIVGHWAVFVKGEHLATFKNDFDAKWVYWNKATDLSVQPEDIEIKQITRKTPFTE